jgi:osmotically-inducible protein OsmY
MTHNREAMERPGPPLPDYGRMSDAEIAAVVRAYLRQGGGSAFDLVEIDVQGRHICLRGEVPSKAARQLAAKIVADEMGLEVSDELRVTSTLWKQGEDEPKHGVDARTRRDDQR